MAHSKKYIISDLHFGHKNIIKYANGLRGGTTMEEHDDWLVDQINSIVTKNDLLYVLGDVSMSRDGLKHMSRLKGNKILIRGNHDVYAVQDYLKHFQQIHGLWRHKDTFWMSHAPIHPGSLRGLFNLHGHVHQNSVPDENYINCCVEMTYGVPQDLDALTEKYKAVLNSRREVETKG